MNRRLIRYRTKPGRADENRRLIEAVFRELHEKAPEGVGYLALSLEDGSFLHLVSLEGDVNPIPKLEAFHKFQSEIEERCVEEPQAAAVTVVGNYRMLGEPVSGGAK